VEDLNLDQVGVGYLLRCRRRRILRWISPAGEEREREDVKFCYFRGDSKLNLRFTAKRSAREGERIGGK
jgi:hypothetical protein